MMFDGVTVVNRQKAKRRAEKKRQQHDLSRS
jgi:hypothetical protein